MKIVAIRVESNAEYPFWISRDHHGTAGAVASPPPTCGPRPIRSAAARRAGSTIYDVVAIAAAQQLPRVHVANGNESEASLRDVCDQLLNVVITGPRMPEKLGSAMTSRQAAPIPGAALRGAGMLSREGLPHKADAEFCRSEGTTTAVPAESATGDCSLEIERLTRALLSTRALEGSNTCDHGRTSGQPSGQPSHAGLQALTGTPVH